MPAQYLATGHTTGDECSSTYEGRHLALEESYLTHPSHTDGLVDVGDPVLAGDLIVGVAFKSAAAATDLIAIDTEGIWFLTATATDYEGNSAIALGDQIYIHKTTCILSKNSNKYTHQRFGYALGDVPTGTSAVVAIKVHFDPDDATERIGASGAPMPINAVNYTDDLKWLSTAAASGTTYGDYTRIDALAAGAEVIAGRSKTMLSIAAVGNAHGRHDTLEFDTSAGAVTGLGTGHRANLVVANRAVATGTYYGAMAEIYPLGNSAALPANSNAALGLNVQSGTAMDLVGNLLSISATDGSTKPIYTHNPGNTFSGSFRILVNGAVKYIYFANAE
jgi:hypothetical protein